MYKNLKNENNIISTIFFVLITVICVIENVGYLFLNSRFLYNEYI